MGLLRISQTIFSSIGEICKLAIKVAVRNYRNGIVGEIGDFKSNSDPTAWIAPHPAIGRASHSPNTKKLPNSTKRNEMQLQILGPTIADIWWNQSLWAANQRADTKNNRTKKLHVSDNVEARQGQLAHWAMHRKKNCSIIQRLCATHSIKLTDPLKSRIKIVAIKSSEHQHERDIQMMGSDKSSDLSIAGSWERVSDKVESQGEN